MTGFEKIQEQECKINNPFLSEIVKFLLTKPNMQEMYLKEEKNLEQLLEFIEYKALKMCENNKKELPGTHSKYASIVLNDEKVYELATIYFLFSNEKLGINDMKKGQVVSNITKAFTKVEKNKQVTVKEDNSKAKKEQISFFD